MVRKVVMKWQAWVDNDFRRRCDSLSHKTQKSIVLFLLIAFAFGSFYVLGYSLYQIGKKEGKEMVVGHLNLLPAELIQINKEIEHE